MSMPPNEPTEAELEQMRAAYEAELKRITTADMIIQTAVSLINLAGRRLGLGPGAQDERDLEQVRDAIDAVRGLMPVLERRAPGDMPQIREAMSQLQLAYARETATEAGAQASAPGGAGPGPEAPPAEGPPAEPAPEGAAPQGAPDAAPADDEDRRPGPAESSGRLWVPGQ